MDLPTPEDHPSLRWLAALGAGVCWGLTSPGLLGGVWVLVGTALAGRTLSGQPGADALRGALVTGLWWGLGLDWLPETLTAYGLDDPGRIHGAVVGAQAASGVVPWVAASVLVRRGVHPALALGLSWGALVLPLAAVQPLPLGPAHLMAGVVVSLWPAAVGGLPLLTLFLFTGAASLPHRISALVLGLWFAVGGFWADQPEAERGPRVGLIQPQIGPLDARRASTAPARQARWLAAAHGVHAAGAELLLSPETAWPRPWSVTPGHRQRRFLEPLTGLPPMVVGAVAEHPGERRTNSLIAVADGAVRDRYDKRILVPGTERPLGTRAPRHPFVPGTTDAVLEVGPWRVGALICVEDLHPSALRHVARGDPDLVTVATHDGWTGTGPGTTWHLAAARVAAVGLGRWVVRVSTVGPSAVIDDMGRIREETPWADGDSSPPPAPIHRVVEVPAQRGHATGVLVGPWVAVLLGLAWVAALLGASSWPRLPSARSPSSTAPPSP